MFYNNVVTADDGKGGAIFILDGDCEGVSSEDYFDFIHPSFICFVYEHRINETNYKHLVFLNNQARQGSVLYGGILDRCMPPLSQELIESGKAMLGIGAFKETSYYDPIPLAISSKPVRACQCVDNIPDCSLKEFDETKSRGEAVRIMLAAVDQDRNPVSATILASYNELLVHLERGEETVEIPGQCTRLTFHMFTNDASNATLVLEPVGPCIGSFPSA